MTMFSKDPTKHPVPRRLLILCIFLMSALILSACGGKKSWRKGGTPGTKPYTIRGKTYYPLKSAHGFVEEGVASWYGPGFHGKKTANGERYNQYGMTAAHKILPLGTIVTVTNLDTRKSITVRVNDRGPFVDDRVIDLSRKGAEQIGMIAKGTARVRIQTQGSSPNIRDDGDIDGNFFIQVGAFGVEENAEKLVQQLKAKGLTARSVRRENNNLWNVQVGPWNDLFSAEKALPRLLRDFGSAFVVGD